MKEVSHYHITIGSVSSEELERAAALVKAKPTSIDLIKNKESQLDRMVTKYQKGTSLNMMIEDVEHLRKYGFTIERFKMEQMFPDIESLSQISLSKKMYAEIHIKVSNEHPRRNIAPFALSSNTQETSHYFYNARARSQEELCLVKEGMRELEEYGVEPKGIHYELTLFDSNLEHDEWWA